MEGAAEAGEGSGRLGEQHGSRPEPCPRAALGFSAAAPRTRRALSPPLRRPERSPFSLKTRVGWGQALSYATALPAFLMDRLPMSRASEREGRSRTEPTGPPLEDTRQVPEGENFPSLARNSCSAVTESVTRLRVSSSIASNGRFSSQTHGSREGAVLPSAAACCSQRTRLSPRCSPRAPSPSPRPPAPTVQARDSPYLVVLL